MMADSWSAVPRHRFKKPEVPRSRRALLPSKQHWKALRQDSRAAPRCRTPKSPARGGDDSLAAAEAAPTTEVLPKQFGIRSFRHGVSESEK